MSQSELINSMERKKYHIGDILLFPWILIATHFNIHIIMAL